MTFKSITTGAAALVIAISLSACGGADETVETVDAAQADVADAAETMAQETEEAAETLASEVEAAYAELDTVLAEQPEAVAARYPFRNPQETLAFFEVEPGDTVAEVLPGGGWYTKILLPYLGNNGTFIGIDYSVPMWGEFGGFANEDFLAAKASWPDTFKTDAADWSAGFEPQIEAFAFGSMPAELADTADTVLIIRAFHHLTRFDEAYLTEALGDVRSVLKPGGIVGIVQHRAPESLSDEWANGDNGYVKQSAVIAAMESAGFELIDESDINANPKDNPTEEDIVWRLPPTLGTSQDDPELRARMEAIGESDRMTLKFQLPEE